MLLGLILWKNISATPWCHSSPTGGRWSQGIGWTGEAPVLRAGVEFLRVLASRLSLKVPGDFLKQQTCAKWWKMVHIKLQRWRGRPEHLLPLEIWSRRIIFQTPTFGVQNVSFQEGTSLWGQIFGNGLINHWFVLYFGLYRMKECSHAIDWGK
jgi:hypothetical protein